jgi:hypothetical protein
LAGFWLGCAALCPNSSLGIGHARALAQFTFWRLSNPFISPVSMAPPTMPLGMINQLTGNNSSAPQKQTSELAKILGNKEMSQLEKMSRLHSNNVATGPFSGAGNPASSPNVMHQMIGSPSQMQQHPNASMSPTPGLPMTRPNGQGTVTRSRLRAANRAKWSKTLGSGGVNPPPSTPQLGGGGGRKNPNLQ